MPASRSSCCICMLHLYRICRTHTASVVNVTVRDVSGCHNRVEVLNLNTADSVRQLGEAAVEAAADAAAAAGEAAYTGDGEPKLPVPLPDATSRPDAAAACGLTGFLLMCLCCARSLSSSSAASLLAVEIADVSAAGPVPCSRCATPLAASKAYRPRYARLSGDASSTRKEPASQLFIAASAALSSVARCGPAKHSDCRALTTR